MKNADMPAMPTIDWDFKEGHPVAIAGDSGLTKREYFALHAPEVPKWFKELWGSASENERFISPLSATSMRLRISSEGMARLERDWRYKFADLMLEGGEK